ncbi:MAG: hypothetical protein AB7S38_38065 [Vulcanimicrobiota bacterium]
MNTVHFAAPRYQPPTQGVPQSPPPGANNPYAFQPPQETFVPTTEAPPAQKSSGWKAKLGLGLAALAVGTGLGLTVANQQGPSVSQVEVNNPTTLTSEAVQDKVWDGWQAEKVSLMVEPTTRDFGDFAKRTAVNDYTVRDTKSDGWNTIGMELFNQVLAVDGNEVYASRAAESMQLDFQTDAVTNWRGQVRLSPAGQSGPYVSVAVGETFVFDQIGGNARSYLQTIDTRTGETVTLDKLVGQEKFNDLVNVVAGNLMTRTDGDVYLNPGTLSEHVRNSFALVQENGETKVVVAIPAEAHFAAGSVAEFTFPAPPLN